MSRFLASQLSGYQWAAILTTLPMLAVIAIPLIAIDELLRAEPANRVHAFHLLMMLLLTLLLAMIGLGIEYFSRRKLSTDVALAQDRLRVAMTSGRSMGWDWDVRHDRVLWFGDLGIFGLASDSVSRPAQDFRTYVHPQDRERVTKAVAEARANRNLYTAEFRALREDGTVRWVSATGRFYYARSGEPERMLGVAVDITDRKLADEALIKSEEKFSKAFRESPMALTLTRAEDHRYLDINDTFERISGWTRGEVIGRTPFDIAIWVDPGQRLEVVKELLANGPIRNLEVRFRRKNGEQRVGLGSAELIEVEGETCLLSGIIDITDRKQAEEALRQKDSELAEAQRLAQLGSWKWDPKNGAINWSEELYRIHGVDPKLPPPSEQELQRLFTPESWELLQAEMANAIQTGSVKPLDLELLRPDGSKRWITARGEAVRDTAGEVVFLRGTIQDITDRKRTEGKLRESEARLGGVINSAMDAIIAVDETQRIVLFNAAAEKMFGCAADQAVGTGIERFIPERLRSDHRTAIVQFGETEVTNRTIGTLGTLWALRSNGQEFPIEASISQVNADGKKLFTAIIRDVTARMEAEDLLRKSEEYTRDLVLHSPVAMVVTRGPELRVELVNFKFTELFGYTIEDVPDEAHWWPLAYPDEVYRETIKTEWHKRVERAFAHRTKIDPMEASVRCKDGSRRHIEFHLASLGDAGLVSFVDLTERRRTEESLRESEERFRRVVEHIGDALAVDDVAGRVVFANGQFLNLFGFHREELENITLENYVAPEYLAEVRERHNRRMRGEPMISHFEYEGIRRDGTRLWIEAEIVSIKDREGKFIGTQKLLRDVTERKRVEDVLRESEERFRLVANTAPVMIWMSGTDKRCDYFNKPWLDFTGRSLEAELGNGWTDGVHSEDFHECLKTYEEAFDRRQTFTMAYRLRRHDGEYRWLSDRGVPRFNQDGSFAGYIGSCVDITEQKLAEEALATVGRRLIEAHEEERTRIGRELHDDINQRLALVAVELDRCIQHSPHSLAEFHDHIHHAQQRIVDIARDVQGLSHRLHSSKLDYLGLAAAANSFCREFSEQNQVEIKFTPVAVPRTLPKDVSLCLFRVLQEALQNALKHSGVKQFMVELSGTADEIELTVVDAGIGFEEQEAVNRRGLGLISMRERMQLVDGEFSIASQPGKGTMIRARVPLNAVEEYRALAG
jgi:PAS domain S-box-containing protein